MNIIFGNDINEIPERFTLLELDTFRDAHGQRKIAYCVVEKVGLAEFPTLEAFKTVHSDLMTHYRDRQWNYCEQAIESLMGKWNGELDSFYSTLLQRIIDYKQNPPAPDWDGSLLKF
jgi:hypothetical protein